MTETRDNREGKAGAEGRDHVKEGTDQAPTQSNDRKGGDKKVADGFLESMREWRSMLYRIWAGLSDYPEYRTTHHELGSSTLRDDSKVSYWLVATRGNAHPNGIDVTPEESAPKPFIAEGDE